MRPILVVLLSIGLSASTAGPPVTSLASGPSGTLQFQTLTIPIPGDAFLAGEETGTPATAFGVLRLPEGSPGRVPAVVVAHGCSGWTGADQGWATLLPQWGIATFRLDSFSDRGINEVCTGRQRITLGSRLTDAYRALELLRDPSSHRSRTHCHSGPLPRRAGGGDHQLCAVSAYVVSPGTSFCGPPGLLPRQLLGDVHR